ncbi:SIS domain-containing protein [bacterium]|nr:SIS domain-containing protein [bacterium]
MKRSISEILSKFFPKKVSEMEKEIFSQPAILSDLLQRYIDGEGHIQIPLPSSLNRVVLIASGSSYNCAAIISYLMREYAHISTQSLYASEFAQIPSYDVEKDTLYVFISQSGETTDTLMALERVKKASDKTMCITNNQTSKLFDRSDYKLLTFAGEEKSIAATKSLSAQLFVLCLLIAKIMHFKNMDTSSFMEDLKNIPNLLNETLKDISYIKKAAQRLAWYNNISLLGSGCFYPLAKEGALKIREVSYLNTNAYPTGEFLHGHVAALNKRTAVVAILSQFNRDFGVNILKKIQKDYSPLLFIISDIPNTDELNPDFSIKFSYENDLFLLFSTLLILQLTSLETGIKLKRNIDKPSGLNKVVR